jgi:DNA-binding NtrC family response regulator/tetratricopeptide (TPR) repeat protein
MSMRGTSRRPTDAFHVSLRDFAWDSATIATLRHCTLPWYDTTAVEIELPAAPLASLCDLGARDRFSLLAQFAAHEAFLQFAGIVDGDLEPSEWAVVRKRGHDCRLVRINSRNVDAVAAPPLVSVLQEFAEAVGVDDLEALRRSWTRAESVYAEIDARLRGDATADLRWMRLAAAGEVVSPGATALRELWRSPSRVRYADEAIVDAVRILAAIDGSVRVLDFEAGFALQRYAALTPIAPDLVGSTVSEAAAAEEVVTRLAKRRHVGIVSDPARLDPASRRVIDIASAVGGTPWFIRAEESEVPVSRQFVLSPRLAARSEVEKRLETVADRRQWVESFVTSGTYHHYLDAGDLPADTATLMEPQRSYIAALALIGTRVPLDVARSVLRHFQCSQDPAELTIPGVASIDGDVFVFASDAVREQCRAHIPVSSRPALCRAAAALSDGVSTAHLLIEAGDVAAGLERLEATRWTSADECVRELQRVPRAMLTATLAATLAEALIDDGRYSDAYDLVPQVPETEHDFLLARIERRRGDYITALSRLERIADGSFEAKLLHGELLRLLGRVDEALEVLASLNAVDDEQRMRLTYERAIVTLDAESLTDSNHYLAGRYRTYRALQRGDYGEAERLAERSVHASRSHSERIDAWLDRVYASFSSGAWDKTRALAFEALTEVDQAQGDRASAGILFTLAYLAADSAQWSTAEHLARRIRNHYERAGDWPRLFEVELLDAHLAFCRGDFTEGRRLATGVLRRDGLLTQIREAAALIVDETAWIDGRVDPLVSTGHSGNAELDARHHMIRERREIHEATAVTRSDRLKLFRSALRTGRRVLAEQIVAELVLRLDRGTDSAAAPELAILRLAAIAEYPFDASTFGDLSWCFASRNRLGHWSTEGPALFAPADLDRVIADSADDWTACSDRELLYLAGSSAWAESSRQAIASIFHVRAENYRLRRLVEAEDADRSANTESHHGIVGQSPAIKTVFDVIDRVAKRDVPVCIQGESGTGKELVARAMHRSSPRRHKAFVALNCAALPETLIESELFGHARGAFTGADRDRTGLIETADGGTLFLDEIGEMPLAAQAKLLRFLQEGEFRRVGDTTARTADVRVVTATNRRLESAVEEGRFREDLYYRVRGIEVIIPPLRDRGTDVRMLAQHFLVAERSRHRTGPVAFSSDVESLFSAYRWPGNVRELQNTIRAAHAMAGDAREVQLEHLPERLRNAAPVHPPAGSYQDAVTRFRRDLIERSLVAAAGNQNRAAALLNMSRQALAYQIRELGIMVKKSSARPRL